MHLLCPCSLRALSAVSYIPGVCPSLLGKVRWSGWSWRSREGGPQHRLYPWESGMAQRQKGECQSSQSASPGCLAGPPARHWVRIHRCGEASEPVGGLSVGLMHADDKLDSAAEGPLPLWLSLIGLENTGVSLK